MGFAAAAIILAAALAPDFLPPAPAVVFTQVDSTGRELGDGFVAVCALDTCWATFPAAFGARACAVNAVVRLPMLGRSGKMLFSVSPCAPAAPQGEQLDLDQSAPFTLDRHGATSKVVSLTNTRSCLPARGDLILRACGDAQIRVDIVLWTTWRP